MPTQRATSAQRTAHSRLLPPMTPSRSFVRKLAKVIPSNKHTPHHNHSIYANTRLIMTILLCKPPQLTVLAALARRNNVTARTLGQKRTKRQKFEPSASIVKETPLND
jgi:hypothetical protein